MYAQNERYLAVNQLEISERGVLDVKNDSGKSKLPAIKRDLELTGTGLRVAGTNVISGFKRFYAGAQISGAHLTSSEGVKRPQRAPKQSTRVWKWVGEECSQR